MGIFDRFRKSSVIEERANADFSYGSFSITSFFGDGNLVTEEQAMKVPSVAASIELITSSIAQLPIYLYKEDEKGEVEKVPDRRTFLLNEEPNDLMNGHNLKKVMVKDYLFHGASYTKVEKVRNDVIALYNLPIKDLSVTKYKKFGYQYSATINLVYDTSNVQKKSEFAPEELIVVLKDSDDGITSTGILKNNNETISLALNEQSYSNNILKNGALPIGILKAATRLTEPAINRLRNTWESLYGGATRAGKTIILEEGLDYKAISMKPNELDLTNSKKSTISEIARIFNVPESMINSSANKYASNEQNNIYFLQYCIAPIITSIEAALNKALLLESEKQNGYYFRFDTSEILRNTEEQKVNNAIAAMKAGLLSINEARAKVDMKAIDIDYFTWNLGSVFYNPKTGDMTIPNLGKVIDPDDPSTVLDQQQEPTPNKGNNPPEDKNIVDQKKDQQNKKIKNKDKGV